MTRCKRSDSLFRKSLSEWSSALSSSFLVYFRGLAVLISRTRSCTQNFESTRLFTFVFSLSVSCPIVAGEDPPTTGSGSNSISQTIGGTEFQVHSGMRLSLVAAAPLVERPIVATWDPQGRLVVLEAADVKDTVQQQLETRPHRMIRLIDENGDGSFDKRIVAAESLSFPEGVLCVGSSVFVSAPPQIWKLDDEDGDGVCEQRSVWFDGGSLTHCANDLHGPYLGPDGWIYWCKGAFAEQQHERIVSQKDISSASHIFRRRPEGGPIEAVMTGGMDNPVEIAFTLEGERFFTSTFLQHPANGRRDGIAHAIYGGVYGKDHHVIHGHPRTGELMPIMTHLGPAAPSGLLRVRDETLFQTLRSPVAPTEKSHQRLVTAQFNLQKVATHELVPDGASYRTVDTDLIVSNRIDFHPTDVLEDADGSLLIIDTGGWYDLCCPSSGIDQAPAMGGIYRLSSAATESRLHARGEELVWNDVELETCLTRIQDARWWVRDKALKQISLLPIAELNAIHSFIRSPITPAAWKLEAFWALSQIQSPEVADLISDCLEDDLPALRHAAAMAIAVRRDDSAKELRELFQREREPAVLRATAEALGRVGATQDVSLIMERLGSLGPQDSSRALQHSLLYALIELPSESVLVDYLRDERPMCQRYAAMVLDTMNSTLLNPIALTQLLDRDELSSAVATNILASHEEWDDATQSMVGQTWMKADEQRPLPIWFVSLVSQLASRDTTRGWVGEQLLKSKSLSPMHAQALVSIVCATPASELPSGWSEGLVALLDCVSLDSQLKLASWLSDLKWTPADAPSLVKELLELAENQGDQTFEFLTFLASLPNNSIELNDAMSKRVCDAIVHGDNVDNEMTLHSAALAAEVLRRTKISSSNATWLLEHLDEVPGVHLEVVVKSIERMESEQLASRLLKRLVALPTIKSLDIVAMRKRFQEHSPQLDSMFEPLIEMLNVGTANQHGKVLEMLTALPKGDPLRGMQVFRSTRAACSGCHRVGYVGGEIGPDLTRIAATRSQPDLLEAILFPSARQEQSYRTVTVLTKEGRVLSGLITYEDQFFIEVTSGLNQKSRIAREEIDQVQPSDVSIMPNGLADALPIQDLADLVSFLMTKR